MPGNKKPRKRYRPAKTLILNTMDWVKESLSLLPEDYTTRLKIRCHDAFDMLRRGQGTIRHVDVLVGAFNTADALANGTALGIGAEYNQEIRTAQHALYDMATRGAKTGRFLFTGPEMTTIRSGMEIHDAQLDVCTTAQIERALQIVRSFIKNGKCRKIGQPENQE